MRLAIFQRFFVLAFTLLLVLTNVGVVTSQGTKPNIVHIFADDLGWGSVGYNNPATHVETPNIDALAISGMRLNRSYAATVCSPSRANLLTGFHSGHADNDRNGNINAGLRAQDVTVAEILNGAGYSTAIVGKWGWGATGNRDLNGSDPVPSINDLESMPANQGYEFFYGYLNHSAAHDYYYDYVWQSNSLGGATTFIANNGGPNQSPEYQHDLTHLRSEELIRDLAVGEDPFYLQINYTIPHFDLDQILTTPAQTNLAGEIIYPSGLAQYATGNNLTNKERRHAAMISRMDASIGAVIARLEDPNFDGDSSDSILENTIIFFTSDNGTTPEDGLGGNSTESLPISGGLRGGKRDLYEGGIRMPAFVNWPGKIEAGSMSELINDLSDFQATAADIAGVHARVGTDGVSLLPTLLNEPGQRLRGHLLFENFENSNLGYARANWAIVQQDYKLIRFDNGSFELYRVDIDPGENIPLDLQQPANSVLRDELESVALAEGAAQPDSYAVQFRQWVGSDLASFSESQHWSVTDDSANIEIGSINDTWSAVCRNELDETSTAVLSQNVDLLGLELDGIGHRQILQINPANKLFARNEVRIGSLGTVQLLSARLGTARWIDIANDGVVEGIGEIEGDVINEGKIIPGIDSTAVKTPPAGMYQFTVDFSEIDSRPNKDNFYTPLVGSIPQAAIAVDYGISANSVLTDRGFNDFPAEFNIRNWATGNQVGNAISGNNFINLTVTPAPGLAVELVETGFDFWRNGSNSPVNYGLLTNVDGFNSNSVLSQISVNTTDPVRLQALGTSGLSTSSSLEIRLYGWNSNKASGHTHITGADVELLFTEVPLDKFSEIGEFEITGNFTQNSTGCLALQIASATRYDKLVLSGNAILGGTLLIELIDDYLPEAGDTMELVSAGSIDSQFESVQIVAEGICVESQLVYDEDAVRLIFIETAVLLGDINTDGTVNLLDVGPFVELLTNGSFQLEADVNKDGAVNLLDVGGFVDLLATQ